MMNMKKLLALLLAIVMVVGMFPMGVLAQETEAKLHTDTCSDQCETADCGCPCHVYRHLENCGEECTGMVTVEDAEAECECDCHFVHEETCGEACEGKTESGEDCVCLCHAEHAPACVENCQGKTKFDEDCTCTCHEPATNQGGILNKIVDGMKNLLGAGKPEGNTEETTESTEATTEETTEGTTEVTTEATTETTTETTEPPVMAPPPAVQTLFDQLMAAQNVEDMYQIVLGVMFTEPDTLRALTEEEIHAVLAYIDQLDPEKDDEDYTDLTDTLTCLPAMECEECGEFGGHAEGCTKNYADLAAGDVASGTYTGTQLKAKKSTAGLIKLLGDVKLTSPLEINAGETITLDLNGQVLQVTGYCRAITIDGGTLTIKDSQTGTTHKGTMKKVTSWLDKRANYSSYGTQYNTTDVFADRFDLKTTENTEIWEYDKSGSTVIKGGIITGGKEYLGGGILVKNQGILNINAGTIAGCGVYRMFNATAFKDNNRFIPNATEIKATGFTITNLSPNGGGVYCASGSTFNMNGGAILYNWADYCGGGVYTTGENTVYNMNSGSISDNFCRGEGGGIAVRASSVFNLGHGTNVPEISLNKTSDTNYTGGGGGMSISAATIVFKKGKIHSNYARGSGGGIYCYRGGNVTTSADSVISDNSGSTGGGIYIQYGKVEVIGSTIENNTARNGSGGAVSARVGNFIMNGGILRNNSATVNGGAVNVTAQNNITPHYDNGHLGGSAELKNAQIYGNNTSGSGGALYVDVANSTANITVDVENCDIHNNTATKQGGAIALAGGTLTVDGEKTKVYENNAGQGGAFYVAEKVRTSGSNRPYTVNRTAEEGLGNIYYEEKGYWNNAINSANIIYSTDTRDGIVVIKSGSYYDNQATSGNGGAVYVDGGSFTMENGNISSNMASIDGGAVYVNGGNFTMKNGTMSANKGVNGGAAYIKGGNVEITHGHLNSNEASASGGAIYMDAADSTTLKLQTGQMNGNKATNDGGAIYATKGTIYIGLSACPTNDTATTCGHHSVSDGCAHPQIQTNTAGDTGGAISLEGNGKVYFYCGAAIGNNALYQGVGHNVFMNGGELWLFKSGSVGAAAEPDLVIVGGKLHNANVAKKDIELLYYKTNEETETEMSGTAEYEEFMNLPDGKYFWPEYAQAEELVFLGWTAMGKSSGTGNQVVRHKEQYIDSGDPVQILDQEEVIVPSNASDQLKQTLENTKKIYDGAADNKMHMYAMWAPAKSDIVYVDNITWTEMSGNGLPAQYSFSYRPETTNIPAVKKLGYELVGWYIYQLDVDEEGNPLNANWNANESDKSYEPTYKSATDKSYQNLDYSKLVYLKLKDADTTLELQTGLTNFGKIVLVANYVPAYTNLRISKSGSQSIDENQSFIFNISGKPDNTNLPAIDMNVVIQGNGFVQINELPVGTYTVKEITDWSWRYESKYAVEKTIAATNPQNDYVAGFTNVRENPYWLSGDSYCENNWGTKTNLKVG